MRSETGQAFQMTSLKHNKSAHGIVSLSALLMTYFGFSAHSLNLGLGYPAIFLRVLFPEFISMDGVQEASAQLVTSCPRLVKEVEAFLKT